MVLLSLFSGEGEPALSTHLNTVASCPSIRLSVSEALPLFSPHCISKLVVCYCDGMLLTQSTASCFDSTSTIHEAEMNSKAATWRNGVWLTFSFLMVEEKPDLMLKCEGRRFSQGRYLSGLWSQAEISPYKSRLSHRCFRCRSHLERLCMCTAKVFI